MITRRNTEYLARELGYLAPHDMNPERIKNARAVVRSRIKRWHDGGWSFEVKIDEKTGEKLYLESEILAAHAASTGSGNRRKTIT